MSIFRTILAVLLCGTISASATEYYVSPSGDDANPGTAALPFRTIQKAVGLSSTVFRPGDTVVVRGGIYLNTTTISISKSGSSAALYYLLAYPGERPLLDFSSMPFGSSNRGLYLSGSFWLIRGLDVKGAGDNGMYVTGSRNTIEFCSFFENQDTGLQLSNGASRNRVINCDSYFNRDPGQGNADGFAPKLTVGDSNYFYGCRSWQNSDDGWDGYLDTSNDITTILDSCWCFANGYLKDGTASVGNGNGFKLGGSTLRDRKHNFVLRNCVSFDNRVKGFDQNNNRGSMTLLNCSGFRDGLRIYSIGDTLAPGKTLTVMNCLALGPYGSLHALAVQQTNSWLPPFATVTGSDFLSVDTTGMRGPRKADGGLPDVQFLVPAPGSQLVDAGSDLGLPFFGPKPDLGAFETPAPVAVETEEPLRPREILLFAAFPNPFNPSTTIAIDCPTRSRIVLRVYDLGGRCVRELLNEEREGRISVRWDGRNTEGLSVASGLYLLHLQTGRESRTISCALIR
jgi:hypothetical protein